MVRGPPFSDATLLVIQLGDELRRPVRFGRNYVNTRTPRAKLRIHYPRFHDCFDLDPLENVWFKGPARRPVPRGRLEDLLELVVRGGAPAEEEGAWASVKAGVQGSGYRGDEDVTPGWSRAPPPPPPAPPSDEFVLPEFERLWKYVERCARLPALLVIDSVDALSAHYDIPVRELVRAIQEDLVETGYASAILVYEGSDWPPWFSRMDALLSWTPIRHPSRRPHWLLSLDYVVGRVDSPQRFVMSLLSGRLDSGPSEEDLVNMLSHPRWNPPVQTIPSEVIRILEPPFVDEPLSP